MAVLRRHVKPNDFHSYKVEIDGKDFSNIVNAFDVFQDVFSATWTANMLVTDAGNFQITEDISVGSMVTIDIESDGQEPCVGILKKSFQFILHSISDKMLIKKDLYGYNIKLVGIAQIDDFKKRVSKSYKSKKAEDIVSDIVKEHLNSKLDGKDTTEGNYDVIIPNMSPFSAISYVSKFAKASNKEADFLFFQSDNGKYKYKSLDNMFNDGMGGDYKLIHKEINYRKSSTKEDSDAFQKIQKYVFVNQLDGLRNMASGFFGSTAIAHDIIHKKIISTKYKYSQYSPEDAANKPFKGSSFNNSELSAISYMTLHEGMTSGGKSFHENHNTWEGSRRSSVLKLDTNRLIVEIAGGTCWWKSLGKMIKVELPSQGDRNPDDKYYTGQYVVLAIKHSIIGNNYTIIMELGKKRLNKAIS